jgi:hypothetical protein
MMKDYLMNQRKSRTLLEIIGICFLLLTVTFSGLIRSQDETADPFTLLNPALQPTGFGGGEAELPLDQLTAEQEQTIQEAINRSLAQLSEAGLLAPTNAQSVMLEWPLAAANGLDDYGYHAISGFVDQDPRYPDYFTWPFPQIKMNNDQVTAVAAAAGTIIYKQDGNFDKNCSFNSGTWNAVFVRHSDGSVAWYGHLKNGSLTSKGIGETVAVGEYLGVIGSSGNSTGPHLHFELYDGGQLTDPYAGSCNQLSASSWWAAQRPYYDSAVNKVMTGDAKVAFQSCPTPDIPNEKEEFSSGDEVFFTTFYRDQLSSQTSDYNIFRPDNSVFQSWSHNSNASHYAASYWWWSFDLPAEAQPGRWRFEVEFDGVIFVKPFTVTKVLDIASPTGGEFWQPGSDHALSWQGNLTDTIRIDLYTKGVFSETITVAAANGGSYLWSIPPDTAVALGYQLRFTDLAEPSFYRESSAFAIGTMDQFLAHYLPLILRE